MAIRSVSLFAAIVFLACVGRAEPDLKIGLIGLDTSHVVELARFFNAPASPEHIPGARIVCAFKGGSPDVKQSAARIDAFTAELRDHYGVAILGTIAEVVAQSDAIMIESVDGRRHLEQARQVFPSRKPVYIEKPLGGNLRQSLEIVRLAQQWQAPFFSSEVNRFTPEIARMREAKIGKIRGALSYGPAGIEPHVPDLYNDGVHPAEALYTVLGRGCQSVTRIHTEDTDIVTGLWSGGRTGVLYCTRNGKSSYGVTVFGADKVLSETDHRDFPGFVRAILTFFHTRVSPVDPAETIEIMTFLQAADESKRLGGKPVALSAVLAQAMAANASLTASLPADPHGKLLLSEDFAAPVPTLQAGKRYRQKTGWRMFSGRWDFIPGAVRGSQLDSEGLGGFIVNYLPLRNAWIQFDVRLEGCRQVIFRIQDAKPEHICSVRINSRGFSAQKDDHDHGGPDQAQVFGQQSLPIAAGEWKTVTVEIVGQKMTATIDGHSLTGENPLLATAKSTIEFVVSGQSASFRRLRVYDGG